MLSTKSLVAPLYWVMVGDGYDEFFRQMLPRAVAVARRVTGERASAEDAAVEALARAHLHWSRVGDLPWREAWVLRVTSREALRQLPKGPVMAVTVVGGDEAETVAVRHEPERTGLARRSSYRRPRAGSPRHSWPSEAGVSW